MMEKNPHAIGNYQPKVSANLGFGFGIGPKPK